MLIEDLDVGDKWMLEMMWSMRASNCQKEVQGLLSSRGVSE